MWQTWKGDAVAFRILAYCLYPLLLSGCTGLLSETELAKTGIQPDGSYVLDEREQNFDCRQLSEKAMWHVGQMNTSIAKEKAARKAPPRTMVSTIARAVGASQSVSTNVKVFQREQATVKAMNVALQEKNCAAIDVNSYVGADAALMVP